jgi:hypothetical protein
MEGRTAYSDNFLGGKMINEILCLSAIMFGEARGEPDIGKVAVAYTAINRKADPNYPKNICSVMKQPKQYQFLDYGMPSKEQVAYLYQYHIDNKNNYNNILIILKELKEEKAYNRIVVNYLLENHDCKWLTRHLY